jgi:hypothetical protein
VGGAFQRIKAEYSDIDFRLDVADVSIHKLLLPDDMEPEGYTQFSVIDADGTAGPLAQRSPVLRKIPRKFRVARVFADLSRDQKQLKRALAEKCKTYTSM